MPPVKETSDSLSHPVVETPHIVVAPSRRTAGDYLSLVVATCGVGFFPVAPGTWGSAVGVGVFAGLAWVFNLALGRAASEGARVSEFAVQSAFATLLLLVIIVVSLGGTWAATRCERLLRRKDPGVVVVDEVAGQLITFLFVPWSLVGRVWPVVVGFLLFRVFDIWKPYPINRLEALEAGLGVMADDVLAGAYAATVLSLLISIYLFL
ncbi:MAG TPA: phosphatidylglycerophosphatase A [Pyrinomonadaceae bacterium]|nr:phosphatidylglycerophosphatase A [Pyrinomonadaceae bacterium]